MFGTAAGFVRRQVGRFVLLVTLVPGLTVEQARAEFLGPLTPTDVLRVKFRVTDYQPLGAPGDLLYADIHVTSPGYTWTTTAKLYDDDTLLGTHVSSRASELGPNIFKKAGSVFTSQGPTVVDFSAIDNKTIDGRVDFTISHNLSNFNSDWVQMGIYQALNASSRTVDAASGVATIQIVSVSKVPEPGTFALLGIMIVSGLVVRGWRRPMRTA